MVYAPLVSTDTQTLEPRWSWPRRAPRRQRLGDHAARRPLLRRQSGDHGRRAPTPSRRCSIRRPAAPRRASGAASRTPGFERFEIDDARHMTAHLSHAHAPFITDLNMGLLERPPAGDAQGRVPRGAGAYVLQGAQRRDLGPRAQPVLLRRRAEAEAADVQDHPRRQLAPARAGRRLGRSDAEHHLAAARSTRWRRSRGSRSRPRARRVYTYLRLNSDDPMLEGRARAARDRLRDRSQARSSTPSCTAARSLATGMLPTFHWAYDGDVADATTSIRAQGQAAARRGGLSRSRRRRAADRASRSSTRRRRTSCAWRSRK